MSCLSPIYVLDSAYKDKNNVLLEFIHKQTKGTKAWHHFQGLLHRQQVPCGKCINCLKAKQRAFIYRMDCESRTSLASFFYTLTYDDMIAPPPPDGVQKRHLQNFMKYLRKSIPYEQYGRIRFYACGEYGGTYRRPHYHIVLWFPDKMVSKEFVTQHVLDCWHYGFISDGYLEQLSQSYVAKDMLKIDDPELYEACNKGYLNMPFHLQSMRPGIGALFIEKNKHYFQGRDPFNCSVTMQSGAKLPLPRYFRDKIFPSRVWDEVHSDEYQSKLKAQQLRDYKENKSRFSALYGNIDKFDDWYYSNDGEELKKQLRRNTKSKL